MSISILSGKHKGRKILTPDRKETRPATSLLRGMVFDSCQMLVQDARVLDLFSGSGAMGLEALSRGASFVTFNDLSQDCGECIRKNLTLIDEQDRAEVYQTDAFELLASAKETDLPYDLLLVHPPYPIEQDGYERLISLIAEKKEFLCKSNTSIYLETPGRLEKILTPLLEKNFTIKKCKSRSTWSLFHLVLAS